MKLTKPQTVSSVLGIQTNLCKLMFKLVLCAFLCFLCFLCKQYLQHGKPTALREAVNSLEGFRVGCFKTITYSGEYILFEVH